MLGDLARDRGDLSRALERYREALELGREYPGTRVVVYVIQAVGIVLVAVGQADHGARLLGAAEALGERIGLGYHVAVNQVAAEQAVAAARAALGEPAFAAAWSAGRTLPLAQAVVESLALFEPGSGSPHTFLAGAIEEAPAAEPGTASTERQGPGAGSLLSPRERQVLLLVAEGKSNQEIGEALFISPRTAGTHVANILGKLGVGSRAAAVSLAHSRRLI
jgi:DNA-binding CsgD family transcriptional regulator